MDAQKIANINVIQAASVPLAPVWPRKLLNLVLKTFLNLNVELA
jgi:uncharacterized protein involved in exopolysaccharide biosynthesis